MNYSSYNNSSEWPINLKCVNATEIFFLKRRSTNIYPIISIRSINNGASTFIRCSLTVSIIPCPVQLSGRDGNSSLYQADNLQIIFLTTFVVSIVQTISGRWVCTYGCHFTAIGTLFTAQYRNTCTIKVVCELGEGSLCFMRFASYMYQYIWIAMFG